MNIFQRANNVAGAGIMSAQDWYDLETLTNKYAPGRPPITGEDFATIMAILKRGADEPGVNNVKTVAHLGAVSGFLAAMNMNAEQQQAVADAMIEIFRQSGTDSSKSQIKFFTLYVMNGIQNDGLVQEALLYINDKNAPTRTMARQYVQTFGHKI